MRISASKMANVYWRLFFRIETFQCVASDSNNKNPLVSEIARRLWSEPACQTATGPLLAAGPEQENNSAIKNIMRYNSDLVKIKVDDGRTGSRRAVPLQSDWPSAIEASHIIHRPAGQARAAVRGPPVTRRSIGAPGEKVEAGFFADQHAQNQSPLPGPRLASNKRSIFRYPIGPSPPRGFLFAGLLISTHKFGIDILSDRRGVHVPPGVRQKGSRRRRCANPRNDDGKLTPRRYRSVQ